MTDTHVFEPSAAAKARTLTTKAQYEDMYARSISDPEGFWREQGQRVQWIKPFTKVKNTTYAYPDVSIKWYEDGVLNLSANCIDKHLPQKANDVAIIWEGDNPNDSKKVTYQQLHDEAWDDAYFTGPAAVQSVVKRLRAKLRDAGLPLYVEAVRGVGFRLTVGTDLHLVPPVRAPR